MLEDDYRERQEAALKRARTFGLKVTWMALTIERTRPWVSQVLNGTRYGDETLTLIEQLLRQVEAGEVEVPT